MIQIHFMKTNNDGGETFSRNYSHYNEQLILVSWIKRGSAVEKDQLS